MEQPQAMTTDAAATKTRRITIDPITRLEGHGKIDIFLDENGDVDRAFFQIPELRGFEVFSLGRPAEDMPQITSRICGVCPTAHHMAATKALDDLYKVEPPPAAKKLRELLYSTFMLEDHALHVYVLGGPDFLVGPDAPAAAVAGIVVRRADGEWRHPQRAAADKVEQQFGVMHDGRREAVVGILVAQRVVAVRVGGDDAVEAAVGEGRDVLLGKHLEHPFLADATGVVSRIPLGVVQDADIESGRVEQRRHRAGDVLHTDVVGRVIAHEPQHVHRLLPRVFDAEGQALRPLRPRALGLPEGVAVAREGGEPVPQMRVHRSL